MTHVPHNYYSAPGAKARLCEIDEQNFVTFMDEEYSRHRSRYTGRFVRLIEDVSDLAAQWPDMPNLTDGVDRFSQYPIAGGES